MYYNNEKSTSTSENQLSKQFLCGYNDGQKETWAGTLQWTFNTDYRRGHMFGLNDKKRGIKRYRRTK
jgi:hypothetical protein